MKLPSPGACGAVIGDGAGWPLDMGTWGTRPLVNNIGNLLRCLENQRDGESLIWLNIFLFSTSISNARESMSLQKASLISSAVAFFGSICNRLSQFAVPDFISPLSGGCWTNSHLQSPCARSHWGWVPSHQPRSVPCLPCPRRQGRSSKVYSHKWSQSSPHPKTTETILIFCQDKCNIMSPDTPHSARSTSCPVCTRTCRCRPAPSGSCYRSGSCQASDKPPFPLRSI